MQYVLDTQWVYVCTVILQGFLTSLTNVPMFGVWLIRIVTLSFLAGSAGTTIQLAREDSSGCTKVLMRNRALT